MGFVRQYFPILQNKYLPWLSTIPLEKGLRWVPTWKSTPNDDRNVVNPKAQPSIFTSLKYEIASFARDVAFVHAREGLFSPGIFEVDHYLGNNEPGSYLQ